MHIVSLGDILHEQSNPFFFLKKYKSNYYKMSTAECFPACYSVSVQTEFKLTQMLLRLITVCDMISHVTFAQEMSQAAQGRCNDLGAFKIN